MAVARELVDIGQVTVESQPPDAGPWQAYVEFLKEEGSVVFHGRGIRQTLGEIETKRKSVLC